MPDQPRLIHLKGAAGLEPKCGAADAWRLTNWVRGASFEEVYVPADVVGSSDAVCPRCQEAALRDDTGSDDEVVPDEVGAETAERDDTDPAFAEITDERFVRELARRLAIVSASAEEERDQAGDHSH